MFFEIIVIGTTPMFPEGGDTFLRTTFPGFSSDDFVLPNFRKNFHENQHSFEKCANTMNLYVLMKAYAKLHKKTKPDVQLRSVCNRMGLVCKFLDQHYGLKLNTTKNAEIREEWRKVLTYTDAIITSHPERNKGRPPALDRDIEESMERFIEFMEVEVGTTDKMKWPWKYHRLFVMILLESVYGVRGHSTNGIMLYDISFEMEKLNELDILFVDILFRKNKSMVKGKYLYVKEIRN